MNGNNNREIFRSSKYNLALKDPPFLTHYLCRAGAFLMIRAIFITGCLCENTWKCAIDRVCAVQPRSQGLSSSRLSASRSMDGKKRDPGNEALRNSNRMVAKGIVNREEWL